MEFSSTAPSEDSLRLSDRAAQWWLWERRGDVCFGHQYRGLIPLSLSPYFFLDPKIIISSRE
jgi:hypothetical protein